MHTLTVGTSKLDIDENGGRIAKLILGGIAILGTFNRLDGKEANSHICAPNFGNEGVQKYGLLPHGPSRNGVWEVVDSYESFVAIQYDMPETGTYPTTLRMYQEFYLSKTELEHNISITNIGDDDGPVNLALHYYWYAPQGWENLMVNGSPVAGLVKKDTNTALSSENIIEIPGLPKIALNTKRLDYVQLWTGRRGEGEHIEYNQNFVCIEPVHGIGDYFDKPESIVPPDRSFQASCIIALK